MDAHERIALIQHLQLAIAESRSKKARECWAKLDDTKKMLEMHKIANGIQNLERDDIEWVPSMLQCADASACDDLVMTIILIADANDEIRDIDPDPINLALWECAANYYQGRCTKSAAA